MELITSPSNAKLKQARALRHHKARQESGLFLVEGIHHVGQAVEAGLELEYILYAPQKLTSDFGLNLIEKQLARNVPCYALSPEALGSIADKENPAGLLAVGRQRWERLQSLTSLDFPWGVALVSPQDAGNIGTILRTIDAVGASGLLLLDGGADPYHPVAVRASMGALFWHPVVATSFTEFSTWVSERGYRVYGTSAHGSQDYRDIGNYQHPCILLLGSEQKGLTAAQLAICQYLIRLPMRGRASSLNLAVAASIFLYAMAFGCASSANEKRV